MILRLLPVLLFTSTACVTVNVGNRDAQKADGVRFKQPDSSFEEYDDKSVDRAWRNRTNGNTISFYSECGDPGDPPLDQVVNGVLSGLNRIKIEISETTEIQGREARHVLASGHVDGVATRIELNVFKRNQCLYILSYVGVDQKFDENRTNFAKFVKEFRAP